MGNKRISELPTGSTPTGPELIEAVQGGVNVKLTAQEIADLGGGGGGGTWGSITGTLSAQTDLQNALDSKAPIASPTFTGTVTIPNVLPVTNLTSLTNSRTVTSADDLDQTDNLNIVYADSATPFDITVDLLTAKTQVTVINKGAGTVTLIEGSGVTLVGTTIDIEEGESATIIYEDPANPDVYLSTASGGGGGTGDLTIGVSTITSGTNGNFLYNNSGLVGERTPGAGVATWFQTPSYANLGSALTGTSLWPLLASGGTLTGVYTITSNTANQDLRTGTFTTTANNQFFGRQAGTYTLRNTTTDEFYTRLHAETLVAGANSQKLVSLKLNPTFTNGAFATVSNVALLAETGSVFIGSGIMNSVTKFSIRSLGTSSATIGLTVKDSTGQDYFTCYDDKTIQLFQNGTLRLGGATDYIKSAVAGNLTFSSNGGTLAAGANRFLWGGSASSTTDQTIISLETTGAVNPTSGTVDFYGIRTFPTLNSTGSATGRWITCLSNPSVTSMPSVVGFKHDPTTPANITGRNIAFQAVTGESVLTGGSLSLAYVAKTANYTLTAADYLINCTTGSFTTTFPTAVGITGRVYVVKNTGAGTITLATTSSQTIDGSAPGSLAAGPTQIRVMSDGANWITF